MRIGHGYDVHAFGEGSFVMLGGVKVPHDRGLVAHSDGDVVLHALSDAILGALGLGDIGHHFPDDDPALKGVDSRFLLRTVIDHMQDHGYEIGNIDVTILAQRPKLATHIAKMRTHIANDLQTDPSNCNVKATTTEKLGFVGREEGVAVHAVVILKETPKA